MDGCEQYEAVVAQWEKLYGHKIMPKVRKQISPESFFGAQPCGAGRR